MKTFFHLLQEVIEPGLCHRCGGCVSVCTSVNYGALEIGQDGRPRYKDADKCIECGLCHAVCPEILELDQETRHRLSWSAPMGRVLSAGVARALDPEVRRHATDGGLVTALLLHLFHTGHIDGAIVTQAVGRFQRKPFLATTPQEILESAGFFFDTSHGIVGLGDAYMARSSMEALRPLMSKGLRRVALVGTPCQIQAFRRMETLGVMPSESVAICLGLYCSGNFLFDEVHREELARAGGFSWNDVMKINVKDTFRVHLKDGSLRRLDLHVLDRLKRHACRYCEDYSAELADISFGGLGAPEGWTSYLARTPKGRAAELDARGRTVEEMDRRHDPVLPEKVLEAVMRASLEKRTQAREHRRELGTRPGISQ